MAATQVQLWRLWHGGRTPAPAETARIKARQTIAGLLAEYPGLAPYHATGRGGQRRDHYSISHTEALTVLVIASTRKVGVDVERLCPIGGARLMHRLFSAEEQAAIAGCDPAVRERAWLKCWVSREAYLKALGGGFDTDPRSLIVCAQPDLPARLIKPPSDRVAAPALSLHDLAVGPGHLAVLAVDHPVITLDIRDREIG